MATQVEHRDPPDLATVLNQKSLRPLSRWVRFASWLVVVGVLGAGAWWFTRDSGATTVDYVTQEAARGPIVLTVTATGSLEPLTQVNVGSEMSGIVDSVAVADNDRVRTGQILATLNTDKLRAQRDQAHASRQSAEARLHQATVALTESRRELARLDDMFTRSGGLLPARRDIDLARTVVERAEAEVVSTTASVAQATANISGIDIDLRKAVIRSPLTGIVLDRQVDPGQTVAASFQAPVLFTLAEDLVRMLLSVAVDEADIGSIKTGQSATFTVDAYPGRIFSSTVIEVRNLPKTVGGVVTYEARLEVDNSALVLRPGMTATAEIIVTEIAGALLVPNAALRFTPPGTTSTATAPATSGRGLVGSLMPGPPRRPGGGGGTRAVAEQRVWVLESGTPKAIPVRVGITDGTWTELVDATIAPGTPVIVDYTTRGGA